MLNYFRTLAVILLLLSTIACDAVPTDSLTALEEKPPAPEFELRDMDDKIHTLVDYKGKPVIVNFWATWCPPCRAELPSMNRAWGRVKDDGIAMLAINVGEDEDSIYAFTAEYPIDFTVLLDENSEQLAAWQITGLPTTYVLDPEGRVVYQAVGDREWDNDKLLDKVRALKSKPKASITKETDGKVKED